MGALLSHTLQIRPGDSGYVPPGSHFPATLPRHPGLRFRCGLPWLRRAWQKGRASCELQFPALKNRGGWGGGGQVNPCLPGGFCGRCCHRVLQGCCSAFLPQASQQGHRDLGSLRWKHTLVNKHPQHSPSDRQEGPTCPSCSGPSHRVARSCALGKRCGPITTCHCTLEKQAPTIS